VNIVENLKKLIEGKKQTKMQPWFRGFKGTIKKMKSEKGDVFYEVISYFLLFILYLFILYLFILYFRILHGSVCRRMEILKGTRVEILSLLLNYRLTSGRLPTNLFY
jgi:hypothetical protein